jgi:hypothetical protein
MRIWRLVSISRGMNCMTIWPTWATDTARLLGKHDVAASPCCLRASMATPLVSLDGAPSVAWYMPSEAWMSCKRLLGTLVWFCRLTASPARCGGGIGLPLLVNVVVRQVGARLDGGAIPNLLQPLMERSEATHGAFGAVAMKARASLMWKL